MLPFVKVVAALTLLCVATQADDVTTYSRKYFIGEDNFNPYVMPRKIAFADNSFFFVTCEITNKPPKSNCNVTMETSSSPQKQCNIVFNDVLDFDPNSSQLERMDNMLVLKALKKLPGMHLPGCAICTRTISVINMDNCTSVDLDFPYNYREEVHNFKVAVYHDSFDVHVSNRTLCDGYAYCALRYNKNGERVGKPVNSSKHNIEYLISVNQLYPEKGVFVVGFDSNFPGNVMYATHISDMAVETKLFSFPGYYKLREPYTSSNEHEYFAICYLIRYEFNFHCIQNHMMGHKIMNVTVETGDNTMLGVFNLRQGGIFFVSYNHLNLTFDIKMVHTDGHVIKQKELSLVEYEGMSPSYDIVVDHMETEKEHCFYFACLDNVNVNVNFKYVSKCLDKKTFFQNVDLTA